MVYSIKGLFDYRFIMSCRLSQVVRLFLILSPFSHSQAARLAQLVAAWQPGCEKMKSEWKNGERMRKWRENEEIEREWENGGRFVLYISSFSFYFLPLYSFPISKMVSFCREKKCVKAPQNVRACHHNCHWCTIILTSSLSLQFLPRSKCGSPTLASTRPGLRFTWIKVEMNIRRKTSRG